MMRLLLHHPRILPTSSVDGLQSYWNKNRVTAAKGNSDADIVKQKLFIDVNEPVGH